MRKEKSQAGSRISAIVRDQHGRRYGVSIEKETMHITGPLQPLFQAPWLPDFKYFKPVPEEPTRVWIDYGQAEQDVYASQAEYRARTRQAALQMYKSEAPRMLKDPPPELLQIVGPPPSPVEPIQAAMAGNKWILGFSKAMPAWAAELEIFQAKVEEPLARLRKRYPDADEEGDSSTDVGPTATELEEERRKEAALLALKRSIDDDTEADEVLDEFGDDGDGFVPEGLSEEQLDGMEPAGIVAEVVAAGDPDQDPAVVNESWGKSNGGRSKRRRE